MNSIGTTHTTVDYFKINNIRKFKYIIYYIRLGVSPPPQ